MPLIYWNKLQTPLMRMISLNRWSVELVLTVFKLIDFFKVHKTILDLGVPSIDWYKSKTTLMGMISKQVVCRAGFNCIYVV